MKMLLLFATCLTLSITFAFGQSVNDSISVNKVFGGYQFFQGEKRLNMNQLVNIMRPNEQAYEQIKSARSTSTVAMIFSTLGGVMVGYPVGTALGGGEPNWAIAGIGAGLIVVSIPISNNAAKKAKQAVDIYNEGIITSSFWNKGELKLSLTGNGIGLILRF